MRCSLRSNRIGISADGARARRQSGEAINLKPNSGLSITPATQRYGVDLSVVIDDQLPRAGACR